MEDRQLEQFTQYPYRVAKIAPKETLELVVYDTRMP